MSSLSLLAIAVAGQTSTAIARKSLAYPGWSCLPRVRHGRGNLWSSDPPISPINAPTPDGEGSLPRSATGCPSSTLLTSGCIPRNFFVRQEGLDVSEKVLFERTGKDDGGPRPAGTRYRFLPLRGDPSSCVTTVWHMSGSGTH
jgi:hypothetical protein